MKFNMGGAFGGGLSGAASGAMLGSVFPGVGTAIGAGAGGLAGLLGGGLSGGGQQSQYQQVPMYNQNQQSALQQLLSQGLSNYNPEAIANRARSQFNQQTVPGLAERFTSMGQARTSSPAFASQLGQAGSGLEEALAALQSQMGMQQLQFGLQPQFDTHYQPRQSGGIEEILKSLLPMLGTMGGSYMAGQQQNQGLDKILASLNRN